jgi:hypothetical protein
LQERPVARAIVNKRTLDHLIEERLAGVVECTDVKPLPVSWRKRVGNGCNWTLPGWIGESHAVTQCKQRMERYLHLLRDEFDVPEES